MTVSLTGTSRETAYEELSWKKLKAFDRLNETLDKVEMPNAVYTVAENGDALRVFMFEDSLEEFLMADFFEDESIAIYLGMVVIGDLGETYTSCTATFDEFEHAIKYYKLYNVMNMDEYEI